MSTDIPEVGDTVIFYMPDNSVVTGEVISAPLYNVYAESSGVWVIKQQTNTTAYRTVFVKEYMYMAVV